jgi:hypothetical protein
MIKITSLFFVLFVFLACTSKDEAISLFNGTDLSGWVVDVPVMDTNPDTINPFIVRNGMLVSLGEPRGHLISEKEYQNYRLQIEYRFSSNPGNCGVLLHTSTPRFLNDMFPKSIEAQLMHGNAGDFWCIGEDISVPDMESRRGPKEEWGTTKGKRRQIVNLTDDSENPVGEWNTIIIECFEDKIKVWVNNDMVNHGTNCTASSGKIALQAEGSEVEFRKIELKPIQGISINN